MSDEFLDPDEILDPDDPRLSGDGSGMGGIDRLAQRAVDTVVTLTRRANALAGGVLMFVTVAVIIGFSLGYVAFSGGWQTLWIVVGGAFGIIAIGTVIVAMLRMRSVRKSADQLVDEVRTLISDNRDHERIVITTVEQTEESSEASVVQLSRGFFDMRSMATSRLDDARAVASAVTAVTTFPAFMGIATLIGAVFLLLSPFFLIAIAL